MSDPIEFLEARIAEDEALAQEARVGELAFSSRPTYAKLGFAAGDLTQRYNPARVLAECAAKREIVEAYKAGSRGPLGFGDDDAFVAVEWVMRLLTLSYTSHPDYDPAWRD